MSQYFNNSIVGKLLNFDDSNCHSTKRAWLWYNWIQSINTTTYIINVVLFSWSVIFSINLCIELNISDVLFSPPCRKSVVIIKVLSSVFNWNIRFEELLSSNRWFKSYPALHYYNQYWRCCYCAHSRYRRCIQEYLLHQFISKFQISSIDLVLICQTQSCGSCLKTRVNDAGK